MAKALESVNNRITVCGYTLNNLRFADNIAEIEADRQIHLLWKSD